MNSPYLHLGKLAFTPLIAPHRRELAILSLRDDRVVLEVHPIAFGRVLSDPLDILRSCDLLHQDLHLMFCLLERGLKVIPVDSLEEAGALDA